MVLDLLALVIGGVYGYMKKGRQDKSEIFKKGLLWGLVVGLILAALAALTGQSSLGFGTDLVMIAISVLWIMALFILGVFIGDWLEHR